MAERDRPFECDSDERTYFADFLKADFDNLAFRGMHQAACFMALFIRDVAGEPWPVVKMASDAGMNQKLRTGLVDRVGKANNFFEESKNKPGSEYDVFNNPGVMDLARLLCNFLVCVRVGPNKDNLLHEVFERMHDDYQFNPAINSRHAYESFPVEEIQKK